MALAITDRRLLSFSMGAQAGMGVGGGVKELVGEAPLAEVDEIKVKRLLMGKVVELRCAVRRSSSRRARERTRRASRTPSRAAAERMLELAEGTTVLGYAVDDLMRFHGGSSPAGVAIAYKVLERALPLLSPGARRSGGRSRSPRRSAARARATGSSWPRGP